MSKKINLTDNKGGHWTPETMSRHSGSNQTQVGIYNECLLLDCVRRHPGVAATDISRYTGLSAQTVMGITSRLMSAGLLEKKKRRNTGSVGQPATPLGLCGNGAYSIGINIGRTESATMLINFNGEVIARHQKQHEYPDPEVLLPWIKNKISLYCRKLGDKTQRLAGVGVATFFGFGGWRDIFPIPEKTVQQWEKIDFAQAFATRRNLPTFLINDATAACVAESELGGTTSKNLLYIYFGAFIGGGVILNRQVFFGDNGNACALASLPIGRGQLMQHASMYFLKTTLAQEGYTITSTAPKALQIIAKWRRDAVAALSQATLCALAVLDFNEVVIDGELPAQQLEILVKEMNNALTPKRLQGLLRPQIIAGKQGGIAGCLGAAWLPLYAKYSPAHALLLKRIPAVTV